MPFCRDFAQHAQAAALGLTSYRPRVTVFFPASRALNFDAAVHGYQSRKFRIVQFDSLQRTQCPFDEKSFRAKLKRL